MRKIVIGTRRSKLALTQTNWVIDQLKQLGVPYEFEVKEIVTKGDRILDVTLSKVGGKGLFVKEIEAALRSGEIDVAVHSMKDVPSELLEEFTLAAITEREDPRDVLVSENGHTLDELPAGAIVGTSSLRRSAQILHRRPDVQVKWIRGNVETRLRKLKEEDFSAIVLAAAGLKRLGYGEDVITEYLDKDVCLPAIGQGALGLECRVDDVETTELLAKLHHEETGKAVLAERAFLKEMNGGCQVPIGGYATVLEDGAVFLTGLVGSPDGKTILKEGKSGMVADELGKEVSSLLTAQGAGAILEKVRSELEGS
ncbi:hydroxymethylbilane synthase [Shouchella clausii]|uniref:Porphobilinogen deaminase n=2 Tax=Shouchella TaxID=2893057 RepID=A0A268P145_SHOCL|nr:MULTISPECIES: hydroxymethylbilane synthase [Shouchella]MCM3313360.1 hydroxymethylbilane synthase [Psychrobacillus sp. MER TA 17]ALA54451.1 Porphobilinogen deaminase [Shouchella clausii]MBU3232439.1 hydroxymethylbilane synthase [Shouchella clausii]MBU3505939.1 hydroxymethylbilane synthase [Shouchella clausii]MBU3535670.1 hydroxymethylbilane synthase [Shouchella clausii]